MQRKVLESTAATYPYRQGLWAIPMGFMMFLTGVSNLEHGPRPLLLLAMLLGGLGLCWLVSQRIASFYRENYGEVQPSHSRHVRHAIAIAAWIIVLFVGGSHWLFWSADSPRCIYLAAFALATLTYYAILVGLRAHHIIIWGAVLIAGLLPLWGGLDADRDAIAMFPLGVAFLVSGLLDQLLLVRSFAATRHVQMESQHVGR